MRSGWQCIVTWSALYSSLPPQRPLGLCLVSHLVINPRLLSQGAKGKRVPTLLVSRWVGAPGARPGTSVGIAPPPRRKRRGPPEIPAEPPPGLPPGGGSGPESRGAHASPSRPGLAWARVRKCRSNSFPGARFPGPEGVWAEEPPPENREVAIQASCFWERFRSGCGSVALGPGEFIRWGVARSLANYHALICARPTRRSPFPKHQVFPDLCITWKSTEKA